MSVFERFTDKVSDTARKASKKTSELVEVTKLNMSIGTEEEKIRKAYFDMGKIVYEDYDNGAEIADDLKATCSTIKGYQDNIAAMRQKILELKALKVCHGCGAELEDNIAFCPKCGTKQ